jgi:hypothetical protein
MSPSSLSVSLRRAASAAALLAALLGTASAQRMAPGAMPSSTQAAAVFETMRAPTPYLELVGDLDKLAANIETRLKTDDVGTARELYLLQSRSVMYLTQAVDLGQPAAVIENLRAIHADVFRLQELVQEHAVDVLDRVLPGEPERMLGMLRGHDLYSALFRMGTPVPGAPPMPNTPERRRMLLEAMKQDFINKGGSPKDIHGLGPRTIKTIRSGELVEWAQRGEEFRFTAAGAKHPVIANGAAVRGAGSMKLYRDAKGEVILAVVSVSSGNYKPGIGAAFGLVAQLERLGVPRSRIIETTVLPGEPMLVSLLYKSKKIYSKMQIAAFLDGLEREAAQPHRYWTMMTRKAVQMMRGSQPRDVRRAQASRRARPAGPSKPPPRSMRGR